MSGPYRSEAAQEQVQGWCRSRLETWEEPHESTFIDTGVGPIHVLRAGSGPVTLVYLPGTLVLETTFATSAGSIRLIDFMPPRGKDSDVVRIIRGDRGKHSSRSKMLNGAANLHVGIPKQGNNTAENASPCGKQDVWKGGNKLVRHG